MAWCCQRADRRGPGTLDRPWRPGGARGNNQKQADFLSLLAKADPGKLHDLHMIMPSVSRAEHLDLFERQIARKLDFSFAGPQSLRISQLLEDGLLEVGAIHTYIELYSRLLVDLIPNVALVAGFRADRHGNIYTGPSTEDTRRWSSRPPSATASSSCRSTRSSTSCRAWTFRRAGSISSWWPTSRSTSSRCSPRPAPHQAGARADGDDGDPRHLRKHNVQSLNHGIGFNTAAIELILPTYGESLGLKGKICRNWTLNPHRR